MSDESAIVPVEPAKIGTVKAALPAILARLREGCSLRQACDGEGMPNASAVTMWMQDHPDDAEHYARAREAGWSLVGEDLLDISDDSRNDWMDRETKSGRIERVVDRECIERTRLRLDTRKWMLAKMLPKIYGDRVQVDVVGAVGIAFARLASPGASDDE